jgi:hypothetical protein
MKKILIFVILISKSLADEESISEKIQKLSQLPAENYSLEIDTFVSFFEKVIDKKTFFCQSEVSMEEKKKCRGEIKQLRSNYLNSIYIARKNYLIYLHNRRLEDLENEKQNMLKVIN